MVQESDDIEFLKEEKGTDSETQQNILTYLDRGDISEEGFLLDDCNNEESEGKISDKTTFTSNEDSDGTFGPEPEIHNPLFLQMEMHIWDGGELKRDPAVILLKRNFITSIHQLIKFINEARGEEKKLSKIRLDNQFNVELLFCFLTVPPETMDGEGEETKEGDDSVLPTVYKAQIQKTIDSIKEGLEIVGSHSLN